MPDDGHRAKLKLAAQAITILVPLALIVWGLTKLPALASTMTIVLIVAGVVAMVGIVAWLASNGFGLLVRFAWLKQPTISDVAEPVKQLDEQPTIADVAEPVELIVEQPTIADVADVESKWKELLSDLKAKKQLSKAEWHSLFDAVSILPVPLFPGWTGVAKAIGKSTRQLQDMKGNYENEFPGKLRKV